MADTVSNEQKTIATKGSTHTATQTKPDDCKLPDLSVVGFGNTVASAKLDAGQTTRTFIANQPIVTSAGRMGPPSEAAHAGTLGGVTSHTYRGDAWATSYSQDLFLESMAAVRTNDTTKQNHGNTDGAMLAGMYTASAMSLAEEAKKKCSLRDLNGQCSHGRKLGWPGEKQSGDAWYLEIRSDDEVNFVAAREDITKTPHEIEPKCQKGGVHTQWEARSIQLPLATEEVITKEGSPVFTVPAAMALNVKTLQMLGFKMEESSQSHEEKLDHSTKRRAEEPDWDKKRNDAASGKGTRPEREEAVKAVNRDMNKWKYDHGKNQRANPKWKSMKPDKDALATMAKVNAREIIQYWLWRAAPPTIQVTARACGGSRTAKLVVYPHKKFEFKFSLSTSRNKAEKGEPSHFDMVSAACQSLKRVAYVADKIFNLAGEKLQIKFMVGFSLTWAIEYKECTKTDGWFKNAKYTPARMGREWKITIQSKPLIAVDAEISFSLLNLVVPCMGQTVGTLLRKARIVRADVVFSAMIGLYVDFAVGKDQYDYPVAHGASFGIDCTLAAAIVLGTAGFDVIEFKASFPARFKVAFALSKKAGTLIEATPSGTIRSNFTITLFPDRWWEIEAAHASPEWLRTEFTGKPFDLLTAPG